MCCDFFVYDVTVRYADGSSLHATIDEDPQATAWSELVRAVIDSEPAEPDQPVD